jgi:hypothetical protein
VAEADHDAVREVVTVTEAEELVDVVALPVPELLRDALEVELPVDTAEPVDDCVHVALTDDDCDPVAVLEAVAVAVAVADGEAGSSTRTRLLRVSATNTRPSAATATPLGR